MLVHKGFEPIVNVLKPNAFIADKYRKSSSQKIYHSFFHGSIISCDRLENFQFLGHLYSIPGLHAYYLSLVKYYYYNHLLDNNEGMRSFFIWCIGKCVPTPEGQGNAFPDASDKKWTHSHCYQVNDCQEPNFITKR
jgi:hypothetical protein